MEDFLQTILIAVIQSPLTGILALCELLINSKIQVGIIKEQNKLI